MGYKNIIEILTKDCERYRLSEMGFIDLDKIEDEAKSILSKQPNDNGESFSQWKQRTFREYYREKGFSNFCREHINDPRFEKMIFSLLKTHLAYIRKENGITEVDKYLAPDNDSISYGLSKEYFEEIYTLNINPFTIFGNPAELEQWCKETISRHFPVEHDTIIEKMESNDRFIWEKFYIKLKGIAAAICYQMSKTQGENNIHDLWSDTCLTINKAVTTGIMTPPITAKSIISYAVGIIKNKNREGFRRAKETPIQIDSVQHRIEEENIDNFFDNPITLPENFPSHSFRFSNYIDTTDHDSVKGYFIVILYNKKHPLHSKLIEGVEDKVQKLFLHYIDNLSYEQIVTKYHGEQKGLDLIRHTAQLRQEIKRVKETLLKRYHKLLKENL